MFCLDGNKPEPTTNDSSTTTTDTYDEAEDDLENITHTNNDSNAQGLGITKTSASSNNTTKSDTSSNGNTHSSSTAPYVPLITNRLANNPFVILNNARKRAATQDLEKISSTLFNIQTDSPISTRTLYRTDLKSLQTATATAAARYSSSVYKHKINETLARNPNSTSNKENCEHQQNYAASKKLLISEYPGETSF